MNVGDRVIHSVAVLSGYLQGEVKPEDMLEGRLGMDSLDKIELVMALEDEFEITIEDEDAEKCVTVADVIALVEREIGSQS